MPLITRDQVTMHNAVFGVSRLRGSMLLPKCFLQTLRCSFPHLLPLQGKQFVAHPKSQLVAMEMVVCLSRANTWGTHLSPEVGRGATRYCLLTSRWDVGDITLGFGEGVYLFIQHHQHRSEVTWYRWSRLCKKFRWGLAGVTQWLRVNL